MDTVTAVNILKKIDEFLVAEVNHTHVQMDSQIELVNEQMASNSSHDAFYSLYTHNQHRAKLGALMGMRQNLWDMPFVSVVSSPELVTTVAVQYVTNLGKDIRAFPATFDMDDWVINLHFQDARITEKVLSGVYSAITDYQPWNYGSVGMAEPEVWAHFSSGARKCDKCFIHNSAVRILPSGYVICSECLAEEEKAGGC